MGMHEEGMMLKAYEIMSCPVITGKEKEDLKSIAGKMKKHDIASVVILDAKGKPSGIVTHGDMIRMFAKKPTGSLYKMKAKDIMSKPLRFIEGEKKLDDAARLMVKYKIKRLCVLDKKKKLVGIITDNDIMKNAIYMVDVANLSDLIGNMINTGYK